MPHGLTLESRLRQLVAGLVMPTSAVKPPLYGRACARTAHEEDRHFEAGAAHKRPQQTKITRLAPSRRRPVVDLQPAIQEATRLLAPFQLAPCDRAQLPQARALAATVRPQLAALVAQGLQPQHAFPLPLLVGITARLLDQLAHRMVEEGDTCPQPLARGALDAWLQTVPATAERVGRMFTSLVVQNSGRLPEPSAISGRPPFPTPRRL